MFLKYCQQIIIKAQQRQSDYLTTGVLKEEVLQSTMDLAKLDGIFRSHIIPNDLGVYEVGDLMDLRKMYEIIPVDEFKGKTSVFLNPTFGQASELVGGADADLIIDGCLIDIKTVKEPDVKKVWRQLVGYGVLADIAGDEDDIFPRIEELGIYFSRHGQLWKIPASVLYENRDYLLFKKMFTDEARGLGIQGGMDGEN